jgi:hypothetical protein
MGCSHPKFLFNNTLIINQTGVADKKWVLTVYEHSSSSWAMLESDIEQFSKLRQIYSTNMPGGIATKPPKPVSSVSALPTRGYIRNSSLSCGVGGLSHAGRDH